MYQNVMSVSQLLCICLYFPTVGGLWNYLCTRPSYIWTAGVWWISAWSSQCWQGQSARSCLLSKHLPLSNPFLRQTALSGLQTSVLKRRFRKTLVSKGIKIQMSFDSIIPMGTYAKEITGKEHKYIHKKRFTGALYNIKSQEQFRYPKIRSHLNLIKLIRYVARIKHYALV